MPCSLAWKFREELVCEAKAAKCPEAAEIFLSVGMKGNGGTEAMESGILAPMVGQDWLGGACLERL
jgi:hypothetical protein